jgi:hypothetical protein
VKRIEIKAQRVDFARLLEAISALREWTSKGLMQGGRFR